MSNQQNNDLSPEEDIFYKQAIELLNSNLDESKNYMSSELLMALKNVFKDIDSQTEENKSSINEANAYSGVLNYDVIFQQATHIQLIELFQKMCLIKNISVDDYSQIQHLFHFVSGALLNSRKNDNKKIGWAEFIEYLNLDILIRTERVREDLPQELLVHLNRYLNNLPKIDKNTIKQEEETYNQHFYYANKIKEVFHFAQQKDVAKHKELLEIINKIMNIPETINTNLTPLRNHIINICYNGLANSEQLQEIDMNLEEFLDNDIYLESGDIYYNLIDSLTNKDKDLFFDATNQYLEFYWNDTRSQMSQNDDIEEFDYEKLTLQDKVTAFFTPYFNHIQIHGLALDKSFISFMLMFYDKEIFHSFMEAYEIPYNIPMREEHIIKEENKPDIIDQHYYSMFEILVYKEKYDIANDFIDHPDTFKPFYSKLIEGDKVYEYNFKPFHDLFYLEEGACIYLIEKGVFNAHTLLPLEDEEKEGSIHFHDIFYFLLYSGYDQAFLKLYYKEKVSNPLFRLKDYQKDSNLFCYYLAILARTRDELVNPQILSVFSNEDYSIYEKNTFGTSPMDVLKILPVRTVSHIVTILESLFTIDNSNNEAPKKNINQLIYTKDNPEQLLSWFDRNQLEEHFKKINKEKDSANFEYIKQMLSENNHLRKNLLVHDETFFDTLTAKFPNFNEVIQYYKGQFRLKKLTGKINIPPILLLGEPGIGKTHFAKEFAQFLNTGYTFLDMGSLGANWILSGNNGSFKSAKQGKILESLMKSKTINPIILMDELDKARGGDNDPTLVLYQLLEEINSKEFTDEFVDFSFNASGIIYIASANSIQNIPEPLLSRFKVFNIEKPNDIQLTTIVNNMYNSAIAKTNLFSELLSETIMSNLKKFSLREIKNIIEEAISKALLELTPEQIDEMLENNQKIELEVKHLKNPKKKNSIGFGKAK